MKIMLIGGGSGGHITPLLAVAKELKDIDPTIEIVGICEKGSNFSNLYENDKNIDKTFKISAGKLRRYANQKFFQKITDFETIFLNLRDVFRTIRGYKQARKLLKSEKPDVILIKGGFVAVPIGLAAYKLNIPFITHDSDSTPGLANRIVGKWAKINATGMSPELYNYPKEKLSFVGIPLSNKFKKVNEELRKKYRESLDIDNNSRVLTIVGGSLGGGQLNEDIAYISLEIMNKFKDLVILHVAGEGKVDQTKSIYEKLLNKEQLDRVNIYGFVNNIFEIQGAADVVVTRAGATMIAELSIQGLPIIIVPADLAGGHQDINAQFYKDKDAALVVDSGNRESLLESIILLFEDSKVKNNIAENLSKTSMPEASRKIAELLIDIVSEDKARV